MTIARLPEIEFEVQVVLTNIIDSPQESPQDKKAFRLVFLFDLFVDILINNFRFVAASFFFFLFFSFESIECGKISAFMLSVQN